MNNLYQIDNCSYKILNRNYLKDPNYFPEFQINLDKFKFLIKDLEKNNKTASFIHFGDGDYYFLKKIPIGSARPGKRALKKSYNELDIESYKNGFLKNNYYCVEYLEKDMINKINELYPNIKTIPTEYLYGLTMNKWFFKNFKDKIGLIGAGPKLDIIKNLMEYPEYKTYLGINKFNDYIKIPQKYACDNLEETISMVKTQLENSNENTKIFLFGVGHVKSGLIHHLPKIKNAIYLDIGAGIDGIAGIIDSDRPYAGDWINHRMKNYDYSSIDLLNYNLNNDKFIKYI